MSGDPFFKKLCRVIESSLEELHELRHASDHHVDLILYRKAVTAFHRGNFKELKDLETESKASTNPKEALIVPLIQLRRLILSTEIPLSELEQLAKLTGTFGPWEGEYRILVATAFGATGDHSAARAWFDCAIPELEKIGAFKKALLAELNSIVALSNVEPERKLLAEYHFLYKKARKHRQSMVAATALLNISREYQRMGASRIALKMVNRAVAACRTQVGSMIYYQCIAHRAHVLHDLERDIEAQLDLELAKTGDYPLVRQACEVLSAILEKKEPKISQDKLVSSTWRERLLEYQSVGKAKGQALGPHEESLLLFLSEKPRTKFEICEYLFGTKIDPFSAENRLKNLLNRVRKKLPGAIVCSDGRYFIADADMTLPSTKLA